MTRKRIAAAFLALALAVGLMVPAFAADSGTRTSLEDYTAENSAHAILDYLTENSDQGRNYLMWHSYRTYEDTYSHDVDHIKTPLGNCEETWNYLKENFGIGVADAWHNTDLYWKTGEPRESDSEGNPKFPVLEYLLNDADRQFACVRDNCSDYDLERWLFYEAFYANETAPYVRPKTDEETLLYCKYHEYHESEKDNNNGQQTTQSKEENAQAQWEQSILDNENNRNYLQVLEHNREMMAQEVDPAGYQYTIVTEDIQNKSDEICTGAANDAEKLRLIHDWVSDNIYYDYEFLYTPNRGTTWKAAQPTLDDGRGVCAAYAVLTQALLWAQDIPSTVVYGYTTQGRWSRPDSTGGAHAWNTALIDGEWVTVDTTWDSQNRYYGSSQQYSDDFKLTYFCPTIEFFSTNHKIDKIGMALNGINANIEKTTAETVQIIHQSQEIVQELDEGLKVENYLAQVQEQVKTDTSLSAWAKEEILAAIGKNLVPDCILGEFNQDITRGEFCELVQQMTWQVVGMELKDYVKANQYTLTYDAFADVPGWSKYADSVACVQALGIIQGYGNGNFGPDDSLTRQEAATILARWAKLLGLDLSAGQTSQFADQGQIADWAKESVGLICGCGVMEGTGQGFAPLAHYTREQAIATALRIYDQT